MRISLNDTLYTPEKIIGVGRNYDAHIKEMHATPTGEPVLFIKPPTTLCPLSEDIVIPTRYGSVHHEVELAVLISRGGSAIDENAAMEHIGGYGLALDLTLRDMQSTAKKKGLPWAIAKGFDGACPISGHFVAREKVADPHGLAISLRVNGETRQQGTTAHMIFRLPFLISYISRFFTLKSGDIILTGTPSGVGPLRDGDRLDLSLEAVAKVQTRVVARK